MEDRGEHGVRIAGERVATARRHHRRHAGEPWYVARTDDKQRGRLNLISHLLSQVPYKSLAQKDVTLPKRQRAGGYVEPDLPLRYIPTPF